MPVNAEFGRPFDEQVAFFRQKLTLPQDLAVDAEVDLGPVGQAFGIAVRMTIHLPGMDKAAAEKLVHDADLVCPYSNATRGNINKTLTVA